MASCAGPIGAASSPARYILSGICRASGRGCRSEAARVFSWVAMPPAVSAFGVVACCFPQLARRLLSACSVGGAGSAAGPSIGAGFLWLCIWPFAAR